MNYAELLKSPLVVDDLFNRSTSPFKEELKLLIFKAAKWLDSYTSGDDDLIQSVFQENKLIDLEQFKFSLNYFKDAVHELSSNANSESVIGQLIDPESGGVLEDNYFTSLNLAAMVFKLSIDMLNNNSTDVEIFASVISFESQILWFESVYRFLNYGEWRYEQQKIGHKSVKASHDFVRKLAKDIWQHRKMNYVSSILISQLAYSQLREINDRFEQDKAIENSHFPLFNIEKNYSEKEFDSFTFKRLEENKWREFNRLCGNNTWKLVLSVDKTVYQLISNRSLTEICNSANKTQTINNFKRMLSRTSLREGKNNRRSLAIKNIELLFNTTFNDNKKEFNFF